MKRAHDSESISHMKSKIEPLKQIKAENRCVAFFGSPCIINQNVFNLNGILSYYQMWEASFYVFANTWYASDVNLSAHFWFIEIWENFLLQSSHEYMHRVRPRWEKPLPARKEAKAEESPIQWAGLLGKTLAWLVYWSCCCCWALLRPLGNLAFRSPAKPAHALRE